MAIEISKPQPIRIGDRYLYTLTSYEPVEVTVVVEVPTGADVDLMLESLAEEAGLTGDEIDDEWVREHALGASTVAELRERLRDDCKRQARQRADVDRQRAAAAKVVERLGQAIPTDEIDRYRFMLLRTNELDAGRLGFSLDDVLARTGTDRATFEASLAEEARVIAAQEAAFSAFASERKLKVDESEIPYIIGVDDLEAADLVESAKRAGNLDEIKRQCLNSKAARVIAAECSCIYREETPEEAEERAKTLRSVLETARSRFKESRHAAVDARDSKGGSDLHLV